MKKILIFIGFIMTITISKFSYSQVQSTSCETPIIDSATLFNLPWFGNNQFLLNLVDSVEGTSGGAGARVIPQRLRIPVTAWVYHLNNTTDNITDNVVEQYINSVNTFMAATNSRIRLYLRCTVNHITNTLYYNGVNGSNYNTMFNSFYTPRTLNIHFTNNTGDGFARGRFPWESNPYACYIPTFFTISGNNLINPLANVLTHEMGHALGLLHTHQGRNKNNNGDCGDCYQESVSRTRQQGAFCISTAGKKKCEINGDALCDTDADPVLRADVSGTSQVFVAPDCSEFIRTGPYQNDNWGSQWLPNGNNNAIRNIMSYSFAN